MTILIGTYHSLLALINFIIKGPINMAYHGARGFSADVERVYLEMEAGDTVFFHRLLIYELGTSRTKGYRKAIFCHYAASEY